MNGPGAAPPSIRLEGVSKWYGEVLGLNEVSATFGPGVTGLLGPNGAGKSTLIKLVCGMLRPSLGRVTVCGEAPFSNPALMRRVGLSPESDAVHPHAPILDFTAYLTRLQGFSHREAKRRARAALERVGLGDVLGRSAATFSKGMRQRARLAQALAHDPDVLVLDEPLNGLDPPGRRDLGRLIAAFGAQGRCVLLSSHVLHEVEALTDRVLLLSTGRVLAEGPVSAIRAELPEHPLTIHVETPDARTLAPRLLVLEGVERFAWREGGLELTTTRPDAVFDRLADAAAEGEARVEAVRPMDEDLEAVFRYLTR